MPMDKPPEHVIPDDEWKRAGFMLSGIDKDHFALVPVEYRGQRRTMVVRICADAGIQALVEPVAVLLRPEDCLQLQVLDPRTLEHVVPIKGRDASNVVQTDAKDADLGVSK